jgi:radical SAM protein with 4Fe4S-binding SPASM domain
MKGLRGTMALADVARIMDEVKEAKSYINPYRFSEPLLNNDLRKYYTLIKEKGLPLLVNTNGLLLDKDMADFFMDIRLDSIAFSIDAFTKETFQKVRGSDAIDRVNEAVFLMLEARGAKPYPRISVSYVLSDDNRDELEAFVSFWIRHVDVIRVNRVFDRENRIKEIAVPEKRVPCYAIYSKMVIDYKGDVLLCTTDAFAKSKAGNVLKDGVKNVWHGEALSRMRYYHETGQFDKLPLCDPCNLWTDYHYTTEEKDGLLIRKSSSVTYYNKLDRISGWDLIRPQDKE